MSAGRMAVAVFVFAALSFLMHGYVWARLVRDASWSQPWGAVLTAIVLGFAALIPVMFLATRSLPRSVHAPLAWVVFSWMGVALYLFLLALFTDVGRLV